MFTKLNLFISIMNGRYSFMNDGAIYINCKTFITKDGIMEYDVSTFHSGTLVNNYTNYSSDVHVESVHIKSDNN